MRARRFKGKRPGGKKIPSSPRQESNHGLVKPQAPLVGLQLHINKECSNCCIELIDLVIYFAKSNKESPLKRRRAKVFSFAMISFGRLLKRRIQKRTIRDIHRRVVGLMEALIAPLNSLELKYIKSFFFFFLQVENKSPIVGFKR